MRMWDGGKGLRLGATLASLAILASGCAHLQPEPLATPSPQPAAPVSEFAWSGAPGANAIHGEVAYTDRTGRRWACAGQSVALMPRTPSTDLRMRTLYGSEDRALEPVADVRAHSAAVRGADPGPYVRTTACDPGNHFTFYGLPDGVYFVIARVHLKGAQADSDEGLAVMQRIALTGGVTRQLDLPLRSRP